MATITIVNESSGVRVRAMSTGGYGNQEGRTDRNGEVDFSDSANRFQIQIWSTGGSRWVNTGDVIAPLRGNHDRKIPFGTYYSSVNCGAVFCVLNQKYRTKQKIYFVFQPSENSYTVLFRKYYLESTI